MAETQTNNVLVEMQNGRTGSIRHTSIPINYNRKENRNISISRHKQQKSPTMAEQQIQANSRSESLKNKQILYSAKRGYIILLLITVFLLAVLAIHVVKFSFFDIELYLLNGVTACIISLLLMIPTFLLYRFLEKKVIGQHDEINNKIIETYKLKQDIEHKTSTNVQYLQQIDTLKLKIAEQEKEINKNKISISLRKPSDNLRSQSYDFQLIHGFRKGQMEIQLEHADIFQLIAVFNVVVACITLLPFGQTNYRKKLKEILQRKIDTNKYLQMHFYFFLLSYLDSPDVKRLFRKHRIMRQVKSIADYYDVDINQMGDIDDNITVISESHLSLKTDKSAPFTPYSPIHDEKSPSNEMNEFPLIDAMNNMYEQYRNKAERIVKFTQKDPIKLFRAPIDSKAETGTRIVIPKDLQNRFFDPLNGNRFLEQLVVRGRFSSNAKPYLIDVYVKDTKKNRENLKKINKEKNEMKEQMDAITPPVMDDDDRGFDEREFYDGQLLSSTFVLKQGDDLRKDQAILQMFRFMNNIWRENNLKFHHGNYFVECVVYKCIAMGPDIGIIEMIEDCVELNKINTLKNGFRANITEQAHIIAQNKYNRLITSAAAAYIASFVCGVRDRHHDNVLIQRQSCALFHIDFGYMFGTHPTMDTAKFAITSDLQRVLNVYKNGWSDFVDLAIKAWMILRRNSTELIDFARAAFAFLYKSNDIETFLRDSLKLDLDRQAAHKYIYSKLCAAPKQWKTKAKNLAHSLAMAMKKKKRKKKSDNKRLSVSNLPNHNKHHIEHSDFEHSITDHSKSHDPMPFPDASHYTANSYRSNRSRGISDPPIHVKLQNGKQHRHIYADEHHQSPQHRKQFNQNYKQRYAAALSIPQQ